MTGECLCDHGEPQEWYCTATATRRHRCFRRWIQLCEECNEYCHNRENERDAVRAESGTAPQRGPSEAPRPRA